jgi:hypothetical protein
VAVQRNLIRPSQRICRARGRTVNRNDFFRQGAPMGVSVPAR